MATITEDYVSFETAKLLKEKGFDERCTQYYKDENYLVDLGYSNIHSCKNSDLVDEFAAPTIQMAKKWLREEHNSAIVITPSIFWGEYDISIYRRGNDYPYVFDGDSFIPSYEEACEVAIKYCCENFVE